MPFNRKLYHENWENLSAYIRHVRAGDRCEGSPAYPECRAVNGQPHPVTGSTVILTVAHLDHNPKNNDHDNLRAMCQRCHLTYDAREHAKHAARTRQRKKREARRRAGQIELPGMAEDDWDWDKYEYGKENGDDAST